jgi:deoxyhypusine synthase
MFTAGKSSKAKTNKKAMLLSSPVEHIDITSFDARPIIDRMGKMSFTSREAARAAEIFNHMLSDPKCCSILTLAGSTSAAGCMQVYADMVRFGMVDVIVSTGASIVDMDFFEALGFKHYQGSIHADDGELRDHFVDRIYDTYIDEDELQRCDRTIGRIADTLEPKAYSSRAFIHEMGSWLKTNAKKKGSLVETAFDHGVPIFVPAFTDCSAGFGLVQHQLRNKDIHLTIDSVADFREMAEIMVKAKATGLTMIGGGVPKNFAQDVVLCTENWV